MIQYLNITEHLRDTFRIALAYARENKNENLGVSHLFRALMHRDAGLHPFLKGLDKDIGYLTEWAEVRIDDYPKTSRVPEIPEPESKVLHVMDEADKIRLKIGADMIDTITVLAAIVKPNYAYTAEQLKSLPLSENEILDHILGYADNKPPSTAAGGVPVIDTALKANLNGALFTYCIEKNAKIKNGCTDPVVGRDRELLQMAEILCRRSKPNVLLIGEPGVGKSALVEGFVKKIIEGKVPSGLTSSVVFELDTGTLLAGATYKGEVEDRIKKIIKDLKQFEKAILFIDELHVLADSKGPAGAGVANLLKPELARGELTIIGATTHEEYRKIIEPDAAFNRRFEPLIINEPDQDTAARMIEALIPSYEKHHNLVIQKDVISESVRFAKRYIKDKRLPDAAVDLLDRTMAAVRMINEIDREEIQVIEEEILAIMQSELEEAEKLEDLAWINNTLTNKISPVLLAQLQDKLPAGSCETSQELKDYLLNFTGRIKASIQVKRTEVCIADIASVVAYKTGIPVGKVQTQERDKLMTIESHLCKRVIGQDHAIKILSDTILESRSGIIKTGQPIGSFFFLGPTGTGKTELTKAIAEFLFNDEKAMIRFDMSEFKEEHSAALLYGAPPGYVGYEEGGMLVNKIRQKPYSVVLFDEIEKAHHSVFDTFLQIMDEGVLHDKLGKEGDFSNALIIFTSNIGSEWVAEQFRKGEIPGSQKLMELMSGKFRPEFLARLSEIIPFAPIAEENIVRILDIQLQPLLESMAKLGVQFHISESAKNELAISGFTPKYGARQLSGVIRNRLRRPIARMLISGALAKGDSLFIDKIYEEEELKWNIVKYQSPEELLQPQITEQN